MRSRARSQPAARFALCPGGGQECCPPARPHHHHACGCNQSEEARAICGCQTLDGGVMAVEGKAKIAVDARWGCNFPRPRAASQHQSKASSQPAVRPHVNELDSHSSRGESKLPGAPSQDGGHSPRRRPSLDGTLSLSQWDRCNRVPPLFSHQCRWRGNARNFSGRRPRWPVAYGQPANKLHRRDNS